MNVLMLSPGFPAEMPHHTRGLAQVGARVYGLGDQHVSALPELARESLVDYRQVPSLWNEDEVVRTVKDWLGGKQLHRVVCQWETAMLLAARLREEFGIPGMTREHTLPYRDKELMKRVLDRAGIRTPRHAQATTAEECRRFAREIGFPVILKPIAGAGSQDTYRVDDDRQLESAVAALGHVSSVSVEEFIEGEEYTFDTICIDGRIHYHNVCWYRPKPLIGRQNEWISQQTFIFRDPDMPELAAGVDLGRRVLDVLEYRTGFTHMEWFLTPSGEAVFGEIGGRPPGAKTVDLMNYACDVDLFRGCAEAICHGTFSENVQRRYNAAIIFKRAQGQGRIQRYEGLERILGSFGEHVAAVDLVPIGAPRRNWQQTVIADGYVVVRHPDLWTTAELADRVGVELRIHAGP